MERATGCLQLCGGQECGIEAAIHAMRSAYERNDVHGVIFADASNVFNRLNREVQYAAKTPSHCRLMKRNGTGCLMKRNGPFTIRSSSVRGPCVFSVRFESVLIKYYYIRIALSALTHGSL